MTDNPATNRLKGRVILIAGAASGIGAAIARRCAAEGAWIVCADYDGAAAQTLADDTIICRCEVVTAGELRASVTGKGATEVNRSKAFSRAGMGRCQGRFCGQAGQEIVAAASGLPVESAGRLRGQAPVKPLPLAIVRGDDDA